MRKIRLVLADDHAVVRQGTRELLEQEPDLKVVGEAATGREAVRLTQGLRPDVVIMDVRMPDLSGLEATRRIREAILWRVRRISAPVDDLVRQAEAAIQSNYRTRVRSESISELQRLAAAFNRMIEQIERYRAGLRRYVAAITRSQEEERRRIARELHDDTIQSLVAISRRLELVQASLADPQKAQQQLSALQVLLQGTIEEMRRFSRELRPTLLEDLGLILALRRLVKELTPEGMETDILVQGDPRGIDSEVELALYRIAQEAISNVRRHAQAHRVEVRLDLDSELIHLVVEDEGGLQAIIRPELRAHNSGHMLLGVQA